MAEIPYLHKYNIVLWSQEGVTHSARPQYTTARLHPPNSSVQSPAEVYGRPATQNINRNLYFVKAFHLMDHCIRHKAHYIIKPSIRNSVIFFQIRYVVNTSSELHVNAKCHAMKIWCKMYCDTTLLIHCTVCVNAAIITLYSR